MNTTEVRFIYTTFPNEEEAQAMARLLLEKKLIACANIFPTMHSLYRWENEIQCDQEVVMLLKTAENKVISVEEVLLQTHSYDCPCLCVLPVEHVSKGYLNFLQKELE